MQNIKDNKLKVSLQAIRWLLRDKQIIQHDAILATLRIVHQILEGIKAHFSLLLASSLQLTRMRLTWYGCT